MTILVIWSKLLFVKGVAVIWM